MKKLATLLLGIAGLIGATGCSTPGYTGGEMMTRIVRNWDYENKQMWDEIYYEAMLDPASHTTLWNLR